MKNSDYWKQRFEQLEKARHKRAESDLAEIEKIFDDCIKQLDQKIEIWYRRIAENNGVSMAEARKMLTKNQLKEFRWDVWEYIKRGKENALDRRWIKELENASAKAHITRLEALKIDTRAVIEELYTRYGKAAETAFGSVYSDCRLTTNYEISKGLGVIFNTAKVDRDTLEAVLSKPWATDGLSFSERIWNSKEKLIKELHKELTIDIIQGRDPQKAIDALAKKMKTSKYSAGRLVMTEEAYFASLAQKDELEYLGVEKYEILATLDDRTSDICQNLDGKIFLTKDYEPGTTAPPFHVYCRSTTVPHFDENFGDIGERAARDTDGKTYYVPADMTYPEWHEKFVTNGDKSDLKSLDISEKSGIIKTGSDSMALENQRYGRNKDTLVNKTYIESGEYRRKFDNATDNPMVNKTLYDCAKTALKHRSGTALEDMYWIDSDTGEIVAKEINSTIEREVVYSAKTAKVVNAFSKNKLIALHTHPSSMPPSVADFNSCYKHGYKCGFIACHDGKILGYTSKGEIREGVYNLYMNEFVLNGKSEYDAQILALGEFQKSELIKFWEVI